MFMILPAYTLYVEFADGKTQNLRVSEKNLLSTIEVLTWNRANAINIMLDPPLTQTASTT